MCAYIIVPAITIAGVIVQGTNEAMEYIDKFNQNKSMQIENTPEIYLKKEIIPEKDYKNLEDCLKK